MKRTHYRPESFKAALERGLGDLHEKLNLVVRGTGRALANEMSSGGRYSPGTPIDKGHHRASWHAAIDQLPGGGEVGGELAPDPKAARSQMQDVADQLHVGQTLYMTNNAPAIRRLEFDGWSNQAPSGFVRLAAAAIEPITDEVVREVNAGGVR